MKLQGSALPWETGGGGDCVPCACTAPCVLHVAGERELTVTVVVVDMALLRGGGEEGREEGRKHLRAASSRAGGAGEVWRCAARTSLSHFTFHFNFSLSHFTFTQIH